VTRVFDAGSQLHRRGFPTPSTTLGIGIASSTLVDLRQTVDLVVLAAETEEVIGADSVYVLCHGDIQAYE
jgi:hypothetical protein